VGSVGYEVGRKDLGKTSLLLWAGLDAVWSGLVRGAGHQGGGWRCGGFLDLEKERGRFL